MWLVFTEVVKNDPVMFYIDLKCLQAVFALVQMDRWTNIQTTSLIIQMYQTPYRTSNPLTITSEINVF